MSFNDYYISPRLVLDFCSPPLTNLNSNSVHQHQVFHNGPHNLSLSPPLPLLYTGSYCTTHEMEGCIVPFSLTFCTCCSPPLTSVKYSTMALITSLSLPPLPLLYTGSYCTTHEMEGCIVPFSLTFCTCCSPPLTNVRYSTMALITSLSPLSLYYTQVVTVPLTRWRGASFPSV